MVPHWHPMSLNTGGVKLKTATFRISFYSALALMLVSAGQLGAQAPDGPQADAPAPAKRPASAPVSRTAANPQYLIVPAGTRIGVILENGISTSSAKPGAQRISDKEGLP